MATEHSKSAASAWMLTPAVVLLLGWMLVPLIMTLYFSFKKYLPLRGGDLGWVGFDNYGRFITSSSFPRRPWSATLAPCRRRSGHHRCLLGVLLALLLDQPMWGQGIVRILVIAPFFVMPTVSALVWKNMFMDPVNGVLSHLWEFFGAQPVDWLAHAPMTVDHHDRLLAVAAICHAYSPDRRAIARRRAARGLRRWTARRC